MIYISRIHRLLLKQSAANMNSSGESPNQAPWSTGPASYEGEHTNITVKVPQKIVNIKLDPGRMTGNFDRRLMNWEMYNQMSDKIQNEQHDKKEKESNAEAPGEG